jgi:hypothetical protein
MISGLETRSEPYPDRRTPVLSRFGTVSCRTVRNALDGRLPVELFAVELMSLERRGLSRPGANASPHGNSPVLSRCTSPDEGQESRTQRSSDSTPRLRIALWPEPHERDS